MRALATDRLDELIKEAVARLRDRAAALGGPPDVAGFFNDLDDHPEYRDDGSARYDRGYIEGVVAALNVTVIELLDDLDLT